ncbi:MAG TPA: GAF domain-containing protein [Nevskiaceae bacterium]|nr:GAF domain-containing protein [Nevskiaceae bacterium]
MKLSLDDIRGCLDGAIPSTMATCAADGTPNVAFLSQVEYVDAEHVALSFQFFNKTRANVLANPHAQSLLVDPRTGSSFRLTLRYLRTETSGPLFERMKAKLAGIASHTGMSGVFHLRGSDVYRVLEVECTHCSTLPPPPPRGNRLPALRTIAQKLTACADLEELFERALSSLGESLGIEHAMLLVLDAVGGKLYTVASRGYTASGIGSEIALGEGVVGVAARERTPIRIGHMTIEYGYGRAIRSSAEHAGLSELIETEIPLPGLPESRSQLAVPIVAGARLLGVLYVESTRDSRFDYDDEDALATVAAQLGSAMLHLQDAPEPAVGAQAPAARLQASGAPVEVRHYAENDSVFLGEDYLIKGVAGAIFWALVRDYADGKRNEFSNRELRVDPRIRLPDVSDNLEARLILLERRLNERDACVKIEKTGRGRFRLCVHRPLKLVEIPAPR